MIRKLQIKFIAILMAAVTVLMCVIFGLILGFTYRSMESEAEEALQRSANNPGFLIGREEQAPGLPYFILTMDVTGKLRMNGTVYPEQYEEAELVSFWNQAVSAERDSGEISGYHLRYLRTGNRMVTSVVFVDVTNHVVTLKNLARNCVIVGLISLLLLFGAAVLLSRWVVRPVEQAWEQQRQFVADASHELKTPLTVIMTNAELLQQTEGELPQQYLNGIVTMSRQMRMLVEGLLELARVDNEAVRTSFVAVDYSLLLSDGVLPFEPLLFEKGLTLESHIQEGIGIRGSIPHLQQLTDILLDNAMKYTNPNGCVWVELRQQGGNALLQVANTGKEIPEAELKNIFKRFYRVDKARSRDGSFGLGLSIADRIVAEHGGRIWAESSGGINRFWVQLPLL